ncbi:MAG: hypothetical protein IKC31_06150 [Clostridia bacterium]|nr:hypothetical protein [Clostridia bacterium]
MKRLLALTLALLMCLSFLASCGGGKDGLEGAKEYLDTIMKAGSENTPADYTVLNKIVIGKDEYTITWSVDVTQDVLVTVADDGTVTIDVNERAAADVAYVLTATIKNAKGKTITTSYNRKLPAFKELTWAEFVATEDDQAVVISGIITGIINTDTKHELYLEDADGGYYVYNLAAEKMNGLQIGMKIRVLGIRDTYYGVNQVIDANVEILDATPAPVAAKDITDLVKAAQSFKAEELLALQSTLVTIKNVTVLGQDSSNNTYYNFAIDGKQSYIRISGSANMLSAEDTATFKSNVAANIGMSATATGIVSIYNNQIYLIPVTVDAYADFAILNRTPQEQVEFEASLMDALGTITESGNITLTTDAKLYDGVTITWTLAETTVATLEGNVLNIAVLPDAASEITLTATLTNGDASTTRTFTVKVSAAPTLVPEKVTNPVAETLYKFYLKQYNTKQTLYFAGFEGTTLTITTDPTKAVDVGLEAVEGKPGEYYFFYMVGTAKAYITVSDVDGKYQLASSRYNTGSNTYVYNAELNMLCTTVTIGGAEKTYWFGTYNQNEKIGISEISYINAGNVDVNQFPARFATMIDVTTKTDAEKVATEKELLNIPTSFDSVGGTVALPTTGDLYAKVTITWAVDEADTTGAIVIENGVLTAVPQKDAATVKVIATIAHGTVTETKEFTITVDKAPTVAPSLITSPVVGTAYKLAITQDNLGKFIYLNGEMKNTYYFATTLSFEEAIDVYLEAVDGGYHLYHLKDGVKVYINVVVSGTHFNAKYETLAENATPSVWTFDTEKNILVTDISGTAYVFNSYGTYDTVSPSAVSGASFLAHLYEMVDSSSISDEVKAETEKNALNVNTTVTEAGEITLPLAGSTYADVVITWAVSENACVTIEGGVLTVTLPTDADATVTLTATVKAGEVTLTKEFTLTVKMLPTEPTVATPIVELNKITEETNDATVKYLVHGLITEVKNTTYGNVYITDAAGNTIYIYGLNDAEGNRYDAMAYQPKAGDYIAVIASVGFYKGSIQLTGAIVKGVAKENTIVEVNKFTEENAPEDVFVITGTITEIKNDKYGNVYIADAEGNTIYVYGLNDEAGNRYDAMASKPAVNDTITILAEIGFYKGTIQLTGAVVLKCEAKTETEDPVDPELPGEKTVTISFADKANRTEYDANHQIWVQNGITVTNNKGASTSNVGDYANPGRFYKSSTVIVECKGMTKIEINCKGLDAKYVDGWLNVPAGATATNADGIVTIVFESPVDSITWEGLSAQSRAYDMTIYCA